MEKMKRLVLLVGGAICTLSLSAQTVTFTATGGDKFGEGEGCQQVLDNNLDSKWFNSGNDKYLLFEASEKIHLTGYTFVTGGDNATYGRVPKEWEIFGSNDPSAATDIDHGSWTSIQYVRGDNVMQPVNKTAYYYAINTATTAYKYYKLKIVYGSSGFQISEFIPSYSPEYIPAYVAVDGLGTGSEGYDKLFDSNVNSKWCTTDRISDGRMYWIMFKTDEPVAVAKYRFATANDSDNRDPKSWTLLGLNAASDPNRADPRWEVIDSKADQTFPTNRNVWVDEFEVSDDAAKTKSYNYFLLKITDTRGGGNSDTQFSEFRLNEKTSGYTAITGSNSYNNTTEVWAKAFDNDVNTKWGTGDRIDNKIFWTIFRTSSPVSVSGYTMTSANDDDSRDPRSWVLYGMNSVSQPGRTDAGWTLVDQRTRVGDFPTARQTEVHYAVSPASAAYNYYLLEVDELRGGTQDRIQFAEFKFDGVEDEPEDRLVQYFGNLTAQDRENAVKGTNGIVYRSGKTAYFSVGPANAEPVSINGYSIRTPNYAEPHSNVSRPKSWTLFGSNDGADPSDAVSHWEVIQTVTDDTNIPANNLAVGYFYLDKPSKAYKYFKFDITDSYGDNLVCFADFTLFYQHGDQMNYLTINDGTAPVFNGNVKVNNLTYNRTVTADQYGTVCVPFALPAKAGQTFYTLSRQAGDWLVFDEVAGALPANTPAIFKTSDTSLGVSGQAVVEARGEEVVRETGVTDWNMVGVTKDGTIDATAAASDIYYISSADGDMYRATGTINSKAMRAYFTAPKGGAAKFSVRFGDDETAVQRIEDIMPAGTTRIYTTDGRYVGSDVRQLKDGMYIVNGKTIILK